MPEVKTYSSEDLGFEPSKPKTYSSKELGFADEPKPKEVSKSGIQQILEAPFHRGFSIGENIPVLGPLAAKAGQAFGAGLSAITPGLPGFSEAYDKIGKEHAADRASFAKDLPQAEFVNQVAGGAALPLPSGGLQGATALGKAAAGVGNSAIRVAAPAGLTYADTALRGGTPEEAASAGKTAGLIAGGIEAIPLVGKVAGKAITRGVFGLKPETGEYYRANRAAVNNADEGRLVEEIGAARQTLQDQHETALLNAGVSQQELAAAKVAEKEARRNFVEELKKEKPDSTLSEDIVSGINGLQKKVSQQSAQAFAVLADQNHEIPIGPLKGYLTQRINSLRIGNALPTTGEAASLGKFRTFLDETGLDAMRPEDAKRFVQLLDEDLSDAFAAARQPGGFLTRGDRALIDYRRFVDSKLKEIDAYKKVMEPLNADMQALDAARRHFGSEGRTAQKLGRLDAPANVEARTALENLGERTNQDYLGRLAPYESSKAILKDHGALEAGMSTLPEVAQTAAATEKVGLAAKDVEAAKAWFEPVKGLGPKTAQSSVRAVASETRPNIAQTQQLQYLGELADQDFIKAAKDLGVKKAFETGFVRGSRNVNLGAFSLGGIAGKLTKSEGGGEIGKAIGATLGAAADVVGPQTYKVLVDIIDQPRFQKYAGILSDAANKSPIILARALSSIADRDGELKSFLQNGEGSPMDQKRAAIQRRIKGEN